MGKFSGYLICSDYDGTFATGGQPVAENLAALQYFVENGGRFSLATGRTVDFIRDKGLEKLINAPACLCNGSVVYDYGEDRLLRQRSLAFTIREFVACISPASGQLLSTHICLTSQNAVSYLDLNQADREIGDCKPLKILCRFEASEQADAFRSFAERQALFQGSYICKSWPLGVEFNPVDGTKGDGLDFIKQHLGDIHCAIGVGNYENDLPLLTHGDLSAAPNSSQPVVLEHADMILCACQDGAIRDLIEKLEERL